MATITPFLWFSTQAEEAANFYVSLFNNARITEVTRYSEAGPGPTGSVMTVDFELDGAALKAINAPTTPSTPNAAFAQGKIALFVSCETQAETDRLYDALAVGGEQLPCGWVQDKYGFAWNIVPDGLGEVLGGEDEARAERAMQAMLQMKKLDIDELRRVYSA